MTLSHVAKGDPHPEAHNAERDAINAAAQAAADATTAANAATQAAGEATTAANAATTASNPDTARVSSRGDGGHVMWRTNLVVTELLTTMSNVVEHYVNGVLAGYMNEWGALRGSNPYTTFADSLVRAIIPTSGPTYAGQPGNYIELQDRRIAAGAGRVTHGRRWYDGRLIRKDILIKESYSWAYGDSDPTAGGTITLPSGAQWILTFTDTAANQPVPAWAPAGSITIRPS